MNEIKELFRWSRSQLPGLLGGVVILAVAVALFLATDNQTAKVWDIRYGYWWFVGLAVFLCVSLYWAARDLWSRLIAYVKTIKFPSFLLALLLIFLTAFIATHIERKHRVLSDENSWESMGLQMRFHQTGGICNQGFWTDGKLNCTDEVNNFKGKSLGFLYSLLFYFLPPNRDTALATSLPLYVLSLFFFFLAVSKFSASPWIGLAAAAFLGSMPIYMFQAQSASTEILYVFLLSLLLLIYSLIPPHQLTWKHLLVIIGLLGFLSGTRQESIFCFIPFALYYHSFFKQKIWHFPLFVFLVLMASWPAINTMAAYRGYDFQGGTHAAHSLENLWFNLKSNIAIMINPGVDARGLLKNPFYPMYSALWMGGSLWILGRAAITGHYAWPSLLFILFHIQSLVILVNVSGTFEIDINQRYVLIALPSFAWIMAYALADFLKIAPSPENPLRRHAYPITAILALIVAFGMSLKHTEDFRANILYRNNKLLDEEHFLNQALKKYPLNAIYLYARPWQMLCSGFNSYNEQALLNWSDQEFAEKLQSSGGHIYLVRGQDGYGDVDRSSRVVGFKTTSTIDQILEQFDTEKVLVNSKDFGYPLVIYKILRKKGSSWLSQNISLSIEPAEIPSVQNVPLSLRKSLPDTLTYVLYLNEDSIAAGSWPRDILALTIPAKLLSPGLQDVKVLAVSPEDTVVLRQQFFIHGPGVQLLQNLPMIRQTQGWGTPQLGKSVENHTLTLDGKTYRFGIGAHAPSSLAFRLNGQYRTLHAVIGLDDESACGDGATWIVSGDRRELWRSAPMTAAMTQKISIDVRQVLILELETREGENTLCDHTDWANAWLE